MGSALDLWTAFRERAYLESPQPFLGYFFMLEDCDASAMLRIGPSVFKDHISRFSRNSLAPHT